MSTATQTFKVGDRVVPNPAGAGVPAATLGRVYRVAKVNPKNPRRGRRGPRPRLADRAPGGDGVMDFTTALQAFRDAALALSEAWEAEDGDILGGTYPGYLPSFDEFALDVQKMRIQEREQLKRTVVVTYTGATINSVPADRALEHALEDLPFVADVEVHYEDMLERGEH
jgi:hypothetical protein